MTCPPSGTTRGLPIGTGGYMRSASFRPITQAATISNLFGMVSGATPEPSIALTGVHVFHLCKILKGQVVGFSKPSPDLFD